MRVLAACSLGGASHFNPLLPFLAAARRRGHETLVVGPPALGDMVRRTGFDFHTGGEPAEAEIAPIREQLPVLPREEASVLGNRELFGRLATTAMLPAMVRLFDEWKPDVVLREPCEYASAVVAHGLHVPTVQIAISLADAEAGSIEFAAPALEAHRGGLTGELRASPYVTRFPASLDPSSFAVADVPARVLVTVGHRLDLARLGALPNHVHVERWVDQADVFAVADLVVCHGGSGTTYGALAAGLPLVLAPIFADQFENATRVAAAGAGVTVDGPGAIADGIRVLLDSAAYGDRANTIAAELATTPSADEALEDVLGRVH